MTNSKFNVFIKKITTDPRTGKRSFSDVYLDTIETDTAENAVDICRKLHGYSTNCQMFATQKTEKANSGINFLN